jgi:adenosylhomocysteine nucleosidase
MKARGSKIFKAIIGCIFLSLSFTCALSAATLEEIFARNGSLTIGIISAVPGESGKIFELMERPISDERGKRTYYRGKLYGIDTVVVASRIGKVAAAATATHLILEHNVDLILFTGVAGAIDPSLNIGDVVVANALIQHDMDARPFCPIYEIPLLKIKEFHPDRLLESLAIEASQQFVNKELTEVIPYAILNEFNIEHPSVRTGLVITGDQVIAHDIQKTKLRKCLPLALCVEMEGASVAQVCYEYGIPFAIIRTISDYANHKNTPADVKRFVNQVSGYYSAAIIKNIYQMLWLGFHSSTKASAVTARKSSALLEASGTKNFM